MLFRSYVKAYESYALADFEASAVKAAFADAGKFYPSCMLKGKIEYFTGALKTSIKTFRRALSLQRASVDARVWLARSLLALNDPSCQEEIRQLLFEAIQADGESIAAHNLLAQYYRETGDNGERTEHLTRILEQTSSVAGAYLERAKLYWSQGNDGAALADIDKALALFDADTELARAALEIRERIISYQGVQ
mgnify:CR=1 FL=1